MTWMIGTSSGTTNMTDVYVIPDTSAWIQYFRVGSSPEALAIRSLLVSGRVILVGVVFAELMRGARNQEQLEVLQDTLHSLSYIETDKDTWTLTGKILYALDRTGGRIPVTDALIAAIAIQNNLSVYTQDDHFNRVSDLRLYEPSVV